MVIKVDQNKFFPETCFAYPISEPEFTCTVLVMYVGMSMTFMLILSFVTNLGGVPSPFAFVVEEKGLK